MAGRFQGFLERLLGSHRSEAVAELASDSEILRRFGISGDQEAFELLVWRHGAMVLGVCQRLVRDEHLAEDAFQAVFLVLARKAKTIRSGNVGGWLFRVACRVSARAVQSRVSLSEVPEIAVEPAICRFEQEELSELLDAEISRLPHRLRLPVLLCYLGGRSTEEAARELACPRGTVLSRLSRARKLLTDRLGRRGVGLPAVLPVIGVELNGRIVSATVTSALRFLGESCPLDPVFLLAQGVIRTMKLTKQITVLGAVLLVSSLIGGVGWVSARSGSGEHAHNLSVDDVKPNGSPQLAKREGAIPPPMTDSPVRADQPEPRPEDPDGPSKILKLDPVIARALKPDAKDSPLRKIQKEVSQALGIYMAKVYSLIDIGKWNPQDFPEVMRIATAFPTSLLELMEKPEDKLKCYELEVRLQEKLYKFTDTRVIVGTDPSQNRDSAKAAWLEAQVKVLKLKMEIEKARK